MASFEIRGVIEGFYGVYYTPVERKDLIRFLGKHDYNLYIYGPKNDRQHRNRWREPYPQSVMNQFAETVVVAQESGLDFCYSIGSGVSMNYASEQELAVIQEKFRSFYEIGVKTFAILLDDISSEFRHEEERNRFQTYAEAHAHVCNRLFEWLQEMDPETRLMMCPTDYHGTAPFSSYITELGDRLNAGVDILYTGPDIITEEIPGADTEAFSKAIKRKPIIWDNYPVNDLAMQPEMHIGPITGRDASLAEASKGFVVNTMIQAEASKIPLLTFADYFHDPAGYQPWESWEQALRKIGGEENHPFLKKFVENALQSCLNQKNAVKLGQLAGQALDSLKNGHSVFNNPNVDDLHAYLDELDEAGYHLKNRMANYALRNNLIPWIELLESWAWAGRRAIETLKAIESGKDVREPLKWLKESLDVVEKHPKQITGKELLPLIEYTLEQAREAKEILT